MIAVHRRHSEANKKAAADEGYDHPLDEFKPENSDRKKKERQRRRRREHELDEEENDGPDDDEIRGRWNNKEDAVSILSEGERRERREKYGTKTRSESLLDLKAAAATPPSRRRRGKTMPELGEEEEEETER